MFEVAQMCMVLDGKAESVGDGKGFFHKSPKGTTVVGLSHLNEKINGFWFFVSRKPSEGKEQKMGIFISLIEAYALSISLKQAMFYMGFGTPDTWPTAKELTANSEKKNVQ
jgi:hypothetical protein